MIMILGQRVDIILILALTLILGAVVYGIFMLILSRFEPRRGHRKGQALAGLESNRLPADYDVVFLLPCLNEEEVIGASLDRLTSLDHPGVHIVVIDDGSDDNTSHIVESKHDPRVHLLRRNLPNARKGKGEALNAAVSLLRSGAIVENMNPQRTIVCVVDADGRLEPHVLNDVLPIFNEPSMGAVQIGVRINNRTENLLARMQDIEFVLYTQVFQRGRRHLGSVGLGGNGQFVRLSALNSLGRRPWSRSLAEDLDLGIRLLVNGWHMEFCSTTSVHQQGLVDLKRWVRQRTRWFQGHLQSWPLVPWVLRRLSGPRRVDLTYHITSPYLLLVGSLITVAFGFWLFDLAFALFTGTLVFSPWWFSVYLISVGSVLLFGTVYWREERESGVNVFKVIGMMHLFVLYATLWYFAGWRAVYRVLIRSNSWAKTERLKEVPPNGATAEAGADAIDFGRSAPAGA